MSDKDAGSIGSALFPTGVDLSSSDQQRNLLEQYKLFVQTSESVVARRQTVNTFFLSVNSFLLSAIGVFWKAGVSRQVGGLGLVLLASTGILLCVAWRRLVRSFSQLNTGKFEIIHLLEEHLPAAVFKAEWEAPGEGEYQDQSSCGDAEPVEPAEAHGPTRPASP